MGNVINVLSAIGMWAVGLFLYSIGVMQILLTVFCAIPLTKRFSAIYIVDTSGIYKQCAFTIVLWCILSSIVIALVMVFGNSYVVYGFWIGFVMAFFLSIGKIGINNQNFIDYFESFGKYYPKKAISEIFGDE